jgi:hypothetical protein
MENPDEVVTVNYPECIEVVVPTECMKTTATEYGDWVTWGKPNCWCYRKQCMGDLNGASFFGKPVTLTDLNLFKLAFNKTDAELALVTDGICADLNHAAFFGKRVTLTDLNTFKLYFNKAEAEVPCCDADGDCILTSEDDLNNWETP